MEVQFFTNACVSIKSDKGTAVLCDPWVNEGAFLGSWFHWPPVSDDFSEKLINIDCDAIYISHLHPDHYDPKFVAKFTKTRPEIPIIIADFAHDWLKNSISAVKNSKTELIVLRKNQKFTINSDLTIEIFAADECHPAICGVNLPCQQSKELRGIDSIAVFSADGQRIVNANDAMGVHLVPKIAAHIGEADLIMGHHGGASPYPQCFDDIENKLHAASQVVDKACRMLVSAAESIKAGYIMPFAGQYVLGGQLYELNRDRAGLPIDQVKTYLEKLTKIPVVTMHPEGKFNLSTLVKDSDYVEPDSKVYNDYMARISKAVFPYQNKKSKDFDPKKLIEAAQPMIKKSIEYGWNLQNSFVINDGKNFLTINLGSNEYDTHAKLGISPIFDTVTKISMHPDLLNGLISKRTNYKGFTTMHWNQADVGSHFRWERVGEFNLKAHTLLNFFGS